MTKTLKILSLVVLVSVVFSGCKLFGPKTEKEAFIVATIEATCHIFGSENLFDEKLNAEAKEIYKSYGFDVDDETKMQEISATYSADTAVQDEIMKGIQDECGSDIPEMFKDSFNPTTTEPAAEETPTETPAETPAE